MNNVEEPECTSPTEERIDLIEEGNKRQKVEWMS